MKQMKKKKVFVGLAGILALVIIVGVWAYFSQTSTVENPFDTGNYGSTVVENFKPGDGENWMPGTQVSKEVFAKNTGNIDLIVRARLDETWTRKSGALVDPSVKYKDSANDPYGVYTTSQVAGNDGLVAADGSVVSKNFSGSVNWVDGGDGWYYYKLNLGAEQTTDMWLSSVELLNDADMGKFETKKYVSVTADTDEASWVWVEYTGSMPKYLDEDGNPVGAAESGAQPVLHNKTETTYAKNEGKDLLGYSQSEYNLKVTIQTVQATQEALDAVFGGGSSFTTPAGMSWILK